MHFDDWVVVQTFFPPCLGRWIRLTNIFQVGWNHARWDKKRYLMQWYFFYGIKIYGWRFLCYDDWTLLLLGDIYIYIFHLFGLDFFLSADFHGFSCAKLQSSGSGKNDSSNAASWQNLEIETPAVLFVHWFQDPCVSVQVVKRKVLHSSVYVDIYIYIYVWYVFRWK